MVDVFLLMSAFLQYMRSMIVGGQADADVRKVESPVGRWRWNEGSVWWWMVHLCSICQSLSDRQV